MSSERKLDLVIPIAISVIAIVTLWFVAKTLAIVLVFIPGVFISLLFYFKWFYKANVSLHKLMPLYLVALALQMLHFTEEYLNGFVIEVPILLQQDAYPLDTWIVFNMVAYAIFILGAIALLKQIKALIIVPLFFILVGVVLNGIVHVLISIYVSGYFPGLYTALLMLILAVLLIKKLKEVLLNSASK